MIFLHPKRRRSAFVSVQLLMRVCLSRCFTRPGLAFGLALVFLGQTASLNAQWRTESYSLITGWNAVWLSLDPAVANIDAALASRPEIIEVWRWNPPSGPQFVTDPSTPVQTDPAWTVWRRGAPGQSTLFSFTPNSAYLIRVADGSTAFTLSLQGRPVIPNYRWSTTGVNFVGFPTASPGPTFAQFLAPSAALAWPLDRTKRSRCGHFGSCGRTFMRWK